MSSLSADQRLLLTASARGNDALLAGRQSATDVTRTHTWAPIEIAVDWVTVAVTTTGFSLLYQCFLARPQLHRSWGTNASSALCIASLVTLLLANDGAYQGESGPLGIRQAERPLRIAAQAALLLLFVALMIGDHVLGEAIEISLAGSILFLILEKCMLPRLIAAITRRARGEEPASTRKWIGRLLEIPPSPSRSYNGEIGHIEERQAGRGYELFKRVLDLVVAVIAIVLFAPLLLIAAMLIRLDSQGAVIFRQRRVGRHGRLFTMYKLRSMLPDTPQYGISPSSSKDERITRIGRFLRLTGFDEFPQIFNVVKGEMSLVGPRPEMPFLVAENRAAHEQRLRVRPGITGLWQLSPARAARIHENPQYDNYYVRNRTLSMDLAILLYTPVFLMRGV